MDNKKLEFGASDNISTSNAVNNMAFSKDGEIHQVKFHGVAGEYFKIWIVNILLSILTLGIYSAWATVRRRRYFYGNTEINGDRFDYHATPMQILVGRIIVVISLFVLMILSVISPLLYVAALLLFICAIPWIIVRAWRFDAIMSSFRGVRFNYECHYGRAYWVMFLFPMIAFIALYLVFGAFIGISHAMGGFTFAILGGILFFAGILVIQGIIQKMSTELFINNSFFGDNRFQTSVESKPFMKFFFIGLLIMLPFLLLAIYFVFSLISSIIFMGSGPEAIEYAMLGHLSGLISAYFLVIAGMIVSSCYLAAAIRNYTFSKMQLNKIGFISKMETLSYMGLLFTNLLIVMFTLGLGAPIAHIRHAKYIAECTQLCGDLSLIDVSAHQDTAKSGIADEVAQAFDLNVGL